MKKTEDIGLGRRIKSIRSSLNLNQKEFSEKIGATVSALSNWENGRNKPNSVMLSKIASLADISVEELAYGSYKEDLLVFINSLMQSDNLTKDEEKLFDFFKTLDFTESEESINETLETISKSAKSSLIPLGDKKALEKFLLTYLNKHETTQEKLISRVISELSILVNVIDITLDYSNNISEEFSFDMQIIQEYLEDVLSKSIDVKNKLS